ncbi:hypothetical protein [Streptomyces sp. AGS-58]|uniref:hypothetical protein n=1 Tax=unclassified Streptomyces TaxID=2593676 RepID=UPI0035A2D3EF
MIHVGGKDYPSLEAATQAAGYGGALAGVYLTEPRPDQGLRPTTVDAVLWRMHSGS